MIIACPPSKCRATIRPVRPVRFCPSHLRIALRDAGGAPVVGAAVTFEASSGAQLSNAATVTDANGQAETLVRLQNAEGITLVRADAPAVASSSGNFRTPLGCFVAIQFPEVPAGRRRQARQWIVHHRTERRSAYGLGRDAPLPSKPRRTWALPMVPPIRQPSISSSPPTVPPIPRAPRPATASLPFPIPGSRWPISGAPPNSPAAPMWKWPHRFRRRSPISWRKALRCCYPSPCP